MAKGGAIRELVQDINRRPEEFHNFSIVFEPAEDLCLFLKNEGDGINGFTRFKFLSEGMFGQFDLGLVLVLLESSVEEALEGDG